MVNAQKLHDDWQKNYSDLPFEAYIKQDILRQGISFDSKSFINSDYKTKDYFIFSFDRVPLSEMKQSENLKAPEEIKISKGSHNLRETVISVRINPQSEYKISVNHENKMGVFYHDDFLAEAEFPPIPDYYKLKYDMPKPVGEIAPVIEWGYLIYLTVFRNCQYFGKDEECQYCDINHNWKQQKRAGRPYTGVKPVEYILEALSGIDKNDNTAKAYTITGGSIVTRLKDKNEVDFYLDYAREINKKFSGRWISKIVTEAFEKEDCQKFKDAGVDIYHPNYEIWDEELFKKVCPGKSRFIGRETWIRRILESAEVFGAKNVIPNFVGGVEMAKPYGFKTVDEAVSSTAEGLDFFMSRGISPRFTTWCPEPFTVLGNQEPPPIEYYMKLLREYKNIHAKYKLPIPPGYGPSGAGRAVFSVSAFMDILPEEI
ncbi:MAG: radical SAM protein [Spirochaetia bacterium]|nr:radical SAM protein [Spirochaetia bacterium]